MTALGEEASDDVPREGPWAGECSLASGENSKSSFGCKLVIVVRYCDSFFKLSSVRGAVERQYSKGSEPSADSIVRPYVRQIFSASDLLPLANWTTTTPVDLYAFGSVINQGLLVRSLSFISSFGMSSVLSFSCWSSSASLVRSKSVERRSLASLLFLSVKLVFCLVSRSTSYCDMARSPVATLLSVDFNDFKLQAIDSLL